MSEGLAVLFRDHCGIWSPLDRLYYSSSSNLLVSRHPIACVEEVISSYCPQCLARYTEEEADSLRNRCSTCFQCPSCSGILLKGNNQVGGWYCSSCSLTFAEHENPVSTQTTSVVQRMANALRRIPDGRRQVAQRSGELHQIWRVEDLENVIGQKQLINPHTNFFDSCGDDAFHYEIDESKPIAIPLRTKRTVRCRQDIEDGKMNILVHPKPSPLDGDSSMVLQRGKWWVKDSSAIHDIPFVSIVALPTVDSSSLVLRLTNPKDVDGQVTVLNCKSAATDAGDRFLECDDCGSFAWQSANQFFVPELDCPALNFPLFGQEDELLRGELDDSHVQSVHCQDAPSGWSCVVQGHRAEMTMPLPASCFQQETIQHQILVPLRLQWTVAENSINIDIRVRFTPFKNV